MPNPDGTLTMEEMLAAAQSGTKIPPATPPATPPADPVPPVVDPVPPVPNPADPTPPANPTPNPADPVPPVNPTPPADPTNPMRELRGKYDTEKTLKEKIDGAIQRYTNGEYDIKLKDFKGEDGKINYDAFIKAMDDTDLQAKAKERGISPEVQAELDRIEKDKIEIEKQRLQISMDRALTNLQLEMNLKAPDINQFFKDAMAAKKNPYQWIAQGGDLNDLYSTLYRDKIIATKVAAAVAEAKVKWDAEIARKQGAPTPNPANPTPPNPNPGTGLDLNALLTEAATKKK